MYKAIRVCFCFLVPAIVSIPCFAQFNADRGNTSALFDEQGIRGHIISDIPGIDRLFVEVQRPGSGDGYVGRIPVSGEGTFQFDGSVNQTYLIRVVNASGTVLAEDLATPNPMGNVEIHLRAPQGSSPISGTISAFELDHKVPSKALKEAREADKSLTKKNLAGYIEHLEKAVSIDPDYLRARRNLGVMYLRTGRWNDSIQAFGEVLKRDPKCLTAYAGISSAYLQLQKYPAAEIAARRAVNVDPGSDLGHYFLGVSLQLQGKDDAEALRNLQSVVKRFPKAHLGAAQILEKLGKKNEAKRHLQAYLASGDKDAQSDVKNWLSSLN